MLLTKDTLERQACDDGIGRRDDYDAHCDFHALHAARHIPSDGLGGAVWQFQITHRSRAC
jgi:hypothetical protein